MKLLLGVKTTTPSCMIYGELGVLPLFVEAKVRVLSFWFRLIKDFLNGSCKISVLMFRLNNELFNKQEGNAQMSHKKL